jgi:hypothetical protein
VPCAKKTLAFSLYPETMTREISLEKGSGDL